MFRFARSSSLILAAAILLLSGAASAADRPYAKPAIPAANPIPNTSPFIKPAPDMRITRNNSELISVRMLSVRPTGAGGVQPFKVKDVRDVIDPERRMMIASFGANCSGTTSSPQNNGAAFILPANGTACTFPANVGIGINPDIVFVLTSFTPTTATLIPDNGWTVSPTSVSSDESSGVPNNITISKNGTSYSLTLTVYSDQVNPGEGTGSVSNFMRF